MSVTLVIHSLAVVVKKWLKIGNGITNLWSLFINILYNLYMLCLIVTSYGFLLQRFVLF